MNYCHKSSIGEYYCDAGYEHMKECKYFEPKDYNREICQYVTEVQYYYCLNSKAQLESERKEK